MFKKKCPGCAKKIEKSFSFCPHCGTSIKQERVKEDFGLLGLDDSMNLFENSNLPLGIEKMMNSLMKKIEKQMSSSNFVQNNGMPLPKGFSIKITTGKPNTVNQVIEGRSVPSNVINVSQEEINRRISLPKVEAESRIKRIGDKIIYEINVPGIKDKNDIAITKLASGIEIKAYNYEKCYVKIIPLKVDLIRYQVKNEKVFVELKA